MPTKKLIALTEATLFAQDGAWERLMAAQEKLVRMVGFQLDQPGRVPTYDALTMDDMHNLLISHCGLNGEFINGPDTVLGHYRDKRLGFNEVVRKFLKEVDAPGSSQLSGLEALQFEDRLPFDASQESSFQAFKRCADETEKWLEKNEEVPATVRENIQQVLKEYRINLAAVGVFVAQAKAEGAFSRRTKGTPER